MTDPSDHRSAPRLRGYLIGWIALLILLALNLLVAYVPLGHLNLALNLLIAVIKALVVITLFMHMLRAEPAVRIAAAAGFFFLAVLLTLSMGDYLSRPGG